MILLTFQSFSNCSFQPQYFIGVIFSTIQVRAIQLNIIKCHYPGQIVHSISHFIWPIIIWSVYKYRLLD